MSRISYRNYPILEKINNRKLGILPVSKPDMDNIIKLKPLLTHIFETLSPFFGRKIISVSIPFLETMVKAKDKLLEIINNDVFGDKDFYENGTIIAGDMVIMYCIESQRDTDKFNCCIWKTDKTGIFDYIYYNAEEELHLATENYFFKSKKQNEEMANFYMSVVLQVLLFKKYASVEIVESKGKSKTVQNGTKYLNETDLNIQYLDSKWFTTLVHSEGFKVRGFFRLQPKKKDGEWTKELIWIDEFEKQGYHRKAGILNQRKDEL
jgi:hypothetical protein